MVQEHLEQVSTEIANELHDGPLGELSGLGFRLHDLWSKLADSPHEKELAGMVEEMLPRIRGALRNLCGDLLVPDFRYHLKTELDAYASTIEGLYPGLVIQRDLRTDGRELAKELQIVLYRIYRTLLRNVGKHAGATLAVVTLALEDGKVSLKIRDNGRGFAVPADWETLKRQKHYGLYMANYFAKAVGGSFAVSSEPGHGTLVEVTAPLGVKTIDAAS